MGVFPVSATVGDFNHDGKPDLAVAATNTPTGYATSIAVLLGKGDGTFLPAVNYAVGTYPVSVATADFNGDGNLDLVVANSKSNSVSVLLGVGDGTFQPAMNFPALIDPTFVASADMNRDGKPDLITINLGDSSQICPCVSVMLGYGDGTFGAPIPTSQSVTPFALGIGDFNRDGKLDLAVAESFIGAEQVSILLGNGDGTFSAGASYPSGAQPRSIAVSDFNGDQKLDLAVAENEGIGIGIFLGNGDGTFQPRVDYPLQVPFWVAAADLNGDGRKDLVVTDTFTPSGVALLMGNGDGTFQPAINFPDGTDDHFITVADLNGDHKIDVVVLDVDSGAITLLNTGVVSFSPNTPLAFGKQVVGTVTLPQSVTLTNTGTSTLRISSIAVSKQFKLGSTCGRSLGSGGSCQVSARFTPTSKGFLSGTISLVDSASSKPQVIALSGVGTLLQINPGSLTFPPQQVGTTSSPQTIQLTNVSSTTAVKFSSIAITKLNRDYSQSNDCGAALAAKATCSISVTFHPSNFGTLKADVILTDDGGGSPQKVSLTGVGD